jgi:hypothetical protein
MAIKDNFIEAEARCWCDFCGKTIQKKEHYIKINKAAWKGVSRINICLLCLDSIKFLIPKNELKGIRKQAILEKLENEA